ncbi:MAG: membrane dipeptidase, partial [Desulfatiglandales bacterium]
QAREVMERGGVVGISINPELLWEGRDIPMERLYASIDILVQASGPERVCLGSDVCGFGGQGFSYSDTVSSLKETLLDKGYGPATYQILGGNLIRFLKESFPKA